MNKQLITLGIVIVVATVLYIITGRFQTQNITIPCTQEARICPDGTIVRRVGPNCQFPACPIVTQTSEPTAIDHLTPTTPPGYSCPTTEYVDCMPGPGVKKPQCAPQFLLWAQSNCPNFKGAAY